MDEKYACGNNGRLHCGRCIFKSRIGLCVLLWDIKDFIKENDD